MADDAPAGREASRAPPTGMLPLGLLIGMWAESERLLLLVRLPPHTHPGAAEPGAFPPLPAQTLVTLQFDDAPTSELYCRCLSLAHAEATACIHALLRIAEDARAKRMGSRASRPGASPKKSGAEDAARAPHASSVAHAPEAGQDALPEHCRQQ